MKLKSKTVTTKEQRKFVRDNYFNPMTPKEIAKHLNLTARQVYGIASKFRRNRGEPLPYKKGNAPVLKNEMTGIGALPVKGKGLFDYDTFFKTSIYAY